MSFLYRPGPGEPAPDEVQLESGLLAALDSPPCVSESELGQLQPLETSGLWYLTLDLPADLRAPYRFRVREPVTAQASVRLDPANPQVFAPGTRWARSSLVLPGAPAQPWREEPARGRWTSLSVESAVFGLRDLPVYLPPGYDPRRKEPWPVVLGLDAFAFQEPLSRADRLLDDFADNGTMPASVLVLTHDVGPHGDDHGYAPVVSYLVDEVLPVARTELGIADDPAAVTLAGTSRRGMVAALTAFERPDSVGKDISLSGSFYWRPPGEQEYVELTGLHHELHGEDALALGFASLWERR